MKAGVCADLSYLVAGSGKATCGGSTGSISSYSDATCEKGISGQDIALDGACKDIGQLYSLQGNCKAVGGSATTATASATATATATATSKPASAGRFAVGVASAGLAAAAGLLLLGA